MKMRANVVCVLLGVCTATSGVFASSVCETYKAAVRHSDFQIHQKEAWSSYIQRLSSLPSSESPTGFNDFRKAMTSFVVGWNSELHDQRVKEAEVLKSFYSSYGLTIQANTLRSRVRTAFDSHMKKLLSNTNLGPQKAYINAYVNKSFKTYLASGQFNQALTRVASAHDPLGYLLERMSRSWVKEEMDSSDVLTPYYAKLVLFYNLAYHIYEKKRGSEGDLQAVIREMELKARYPNSRGFDFLIHDGYVLGATQSQIENMFSSDRSDGRWGVGSDCSTFYQRSLVVAGHSAADWDNIGRMTVASLKDSWSSKLGRLTPIRTPADLASLVPGDGILHVNGGGINHITIFVGFSALKGSVVQIDASGGDYRNLGVRASPVFENESDDDCDFSAFFEKGKPRFYKFSPRSPY